MDSIPTAFLVQDKNEGYPISEVDGRFSTDLIRPNLKLVICGTAAGKASAESNAYYAGRGNRFWRSMHEIGLTGERQLEPEEWQQLDRYDVGLTDLAKKHFGMDHQLPSGIFNNERLRSIINDAKPVILAFNGLTSARHFLETAVEFGKLPEKILSTEIWVLPSTSGAANGIWNAEIWHQMRDRIKHLS